MVVVCLFSSAFYISLFSFGVVAFIPEFGVIVLVLWTVSLLSCCIHPFIFIISMKNSVSFSKEITNKQTNNQCMLRTSVE